MTQQIPALSTDPKIRKGQFKNLAREAMATNGWTSSDPVAKVASLLEKVYVAGGLRDGQSNAPATDDSPVPWNAIPARAREILRYVVHYRQHWNSVIDGSLVVLLYGARKVVPRDARNDTSCQLRGDRTWMGLWERRDGHLSLVDQIKIDWPATYASTLVKLSIFDEYGDDTVPAANLTAKGIATFEEAVRLGTIQD